MDEINTIWVSSIMVSGRKGDIHYVNDEKSPREAIRQLFEEYADDIYRYVSYLLPIHYDARDVVQEVFLRAYRAWEGFEYRSTGRTWLYTIARNCVYDLLRKKHAEEVLLDRYTHETRDFHRSLDTIFEYEDLIRKLPKNYRQVIVLRAVEDFSVSDTARVMGISEANVRLTFHRAKKKFAELLAADDGPQADSKRGVELRT